MDLLRLITILRRRFPVLLLGAVLGGLLGYTVSLLLPRTYTATATLLVFQTSSVGNVQLGDLMASERLAHTYADLLTRHPVLTQTIADLHLATTPDDLARQVRVDLVRDTQLLEVKVSDRDPARAAAVANRLVGVFVDQQSALQKQSFVDVQTRLDTDLAANETQRQDTARQLDTLTRLPAPTAAQLAEIARLTGLRAQLDATHDSLLRSSAGLLQAQATSGMPLQLAEQAEVPRDPVSPRIPLNVGLAIAAGLLLAAGLAWVLEYLDDTLQTPESVTAVLALPTLAQVRRIGHPATGRAARARPAAGPDSLRARDEGRSEAAESYRLLRTNLEFSDVDQPPRRLLVTSAAPGEGKSTVAANLAVVCAQGGKRVLLIDSDLRRPALHRIFGVANSRGLTTLLADSAAGRAEADPAAVIVAAPAVDNLALLPSGPLPPNPGDLLGSQRITALLDTLAARYDLLIIDSPPTLAASDPLLLARQVDGVVLVVGAGETRAPLVRQAAAAVRQVGGRLLGVVLNKLADTGARPYYAYYESGGAPAPPGEQPAEPGARPDSSRSTPGALARRP